MQDKKALEVAIKATDEICDAVNSKLIELKEPLALKYQKLGKRMVNACNLWYHLDIVEVMGEINYSKEMKQKLESIEQECEHDATKS